MIYTVYLEWFKSIFTNAALIILEQFQCHTAIWYKKNLTRNGQDDKIQDTFPLWHFHQKLIIRICATQK